MNNSSKNNIKNKSIPTIKNSNHISNPGDRLYQRAKIKIESVKNNQGSIILTNTDMNNKRFEKDKDKDTGNIIHNRNHSQNLNINHSSNKKNLQIYTHNQTINNLTLNKTPKSSNNSELKKRICSNTKNGKYNFEEHINKNIFENVDDEEDEEIRFIPRPIENNSNMDKFKLNDYKKIKNNSTSNLHNTSYSNNNSVTVNKHIYMPDFMASKLVEEILQSKLNT
jgi:hypothetical protein